jgi:hypothetical protein
MPNPDKALAQVMAWIETPVPSEDRDSKCRSKVILWPN